MDDGLCSTSAGERLVAGFPRCGIEPGERARFDFDRTRWFTSLPFHLLLFALTILTTLIVGTRIGMNYVRGLPAFDWDVSGPFFVNLWLNPSRLAFGLPFSGTLLGILLAHELGHYITCRHYGVRASYPYFVPAPTLIGTLGAFIRIKSPIVSRRALFDVGISGPLVGFVLAIPALALGILHSRLVPPQVHSGGAITLGSPLALTLLARLLYPGINPAQISLNPMACAAWVGVFATGLNLLPVGQLDGGHILYAVFGEKSRNVSRVFVLALLPLGVFCWAGWIVWGVILFFLGLRHPAALVPSAPLDRRRKVLALIAAFVFALTFLPAPFSIH